MPTIERSGNDAFAGTAARDEARTPAEAYRTLIGLGTVWVAVDAQDSPVAFLAAGVYPDGLVVHQVSTSRAHQQQGHGAALMQAAIAFARQKGLPRLMLTTNRGLAWNEPWYRRFGFVEPAESERTESLAHMMSHEAAQGHDPAQRVGMVLTLRG